MVVGIGLAAYGTYALLDEHFGWSGGKPYAEMTDEEKSESLGGLVGGTVAGIAGGGLGVLGVRGVRAARGGKGSATKTGTTEEGSTGNKTGEEAPQKGASPAKNLDDTYGAPKKPEGRTGIKEFERTPDGSVVKNPTIQRPEPGMPVKPAFDPPQ